MARPKAKKSIKEILEEAMEEVPEIEPGFSDSSGKVPYTALTKSGRIKYIPGRPIDFID